jgi:hypothetical protein
LSQHVDLDNFKKSISIAKKILTVSKTKSRPNLDKSMPKVSIFDMIWISILDLDGFQSQSGHVETSRLVSTVETSSPINLKKS